MPPFYNIKLNYIDLLSKSNRKMMNSKGKAKNLSLGLKLDAQTLKKLHQKCQGALDFEYYVQAYMSFVNKYYKARILDCRLSKSKLNLKSIYYNTNNKKDQSSYQYYVHYQPLNRRNDQWIGYEKITKTNEKIIQQDHKKKKKQDRKDDKYTEHQGMDHASLLAHQQATKFKTVQRIQVGQHFSETWYYSPYPIYYHNGDCLYICQFCLSFFNLKKQLKRHSQKCPLFHPPGDEVYRDEQQKVAVFQVDGSKNPVYCENLGFLSKLFLDHKNLQWDMSIFLFYILCEIKDNQYHITGYFSKPKQSTNNLSCILVLPFHQRKGYGKFLISFSYQLSLIQGKTGTPQKPLSDLGRQTYLAWWAQRLIDFIRQKKNKNFVLQDIIKETAMTEQDLQWTMDQIGILKTSGQNVYLCTDEDYLNQVYKKCGRQGVRVVKQNIHWIPFKVRWQGINP